MEQYIQRYAPPSRIIKILRKIQSCKMPELGGHQVVCKTCGNAQYYYNSCGDRNCPKCGFIKREKWLDKLKNKSIDCPYFHIVFTLPHELNPLIKNNQWLFYNVFFQVAKLTIEHFYAQKGLKGGMIAVLHTWGQNLSFHPHIHCLVPAGGVDKFGNWKVFKHQNFFAKIKEVNKFFKKQFLKRYVEIIENEPLRLTGKAALYQDFEQFTILYEQILAKTWSVNIKPPIPQTDKTFEYIARYANRVAISESRIESVADKEVFFHIKKYKEAKDNEPVPTDIISLSPMVFLLQLCQHFLPQYFQKIRYYGLFSSACTTMRKGIQQQINQNKNCQNTRTVFQIISQVLGLNIYQCCACQSVDIVTLALDPVRKVFSKTVPAATRGSPSASPKCGVI